MRVFIFIYENLLKNIIIKKKKKKEFSVETRKCYFL